MSDASKKAEKIELTARERWDIIDALGLRHPLDKLAFAALTAKDGARVVDVRWSKDGKDFTVRLVQKSVITGYFQTPGTADRSEMKKRLADPQSAPSFDIALFVLERRHRTFPVDFAAWEEWEAKLRAELIAKAAPKPAVEAEPLAAE